MMPSTKNQEKITTKIIFLTDFEQLQKTNSMI